MIRSCWCTGDQPFAIGSHLSCSFTSNSNVRSRACASGSPLSIWSELSGDGSPCSTSVSFGGDTDIMYVYGWLQNGFPADYLAPALAARGRHVTNGSVVTLDSNAASTCVTPRALGLVASFCFFSRHALQGGRGLEAKAPKLCLSQPVLPFASQNRLGHMGTMHVYVWTRVWKHAKQSNHRSGARCPPTIAL